MAKLLIVEGSTIVRSIFKDLLDEIIDFEYDLVSTYAEAKKLLSTKRYEFAVVDRVLKDAPYGEIIPLFNKHNIAPLVYTETIDEDFFESFEGAQIVDYIQKIGHDNVEDVVKELKQLYRNKQTTLLVASPSKIYNNYLKQNLNIHSFKVINSFSVEESIDKFSIHPEISLVVVDAFESQNQTLELVQNIAKHKKNRKIKIIVLVDETNTYATSELLKQGADDYVVKQFSRDEFYIRIYQNINKVC